MDDATYLTWRGRARGREPPRRRISYPAAGPACCARGGVEVRLRRHALPRVCIARTSAVARRADAARSTRPAGAALGQAGAAATHTIDRSAPPADRRPSARRSTSTAAGALQLRLTDCEAGEVEVGTRVELMFRRMYSTGTVHNYFWKARPLNASWTRSDRLRTRGRRPWGRNRTDGEDGIRDRVAVIGMGCMNFGEHWNRSIDDLLIDAVTERAGEVASSWTRSTPTGRHDGPGSSGTTLSRPLSIDNKPVTRVENYCATGSEAFRNARHAVASGAYDCATAVAGEKLKDSGYSGLVVPRRAWYGTEAEPMVPRCSAAARTRVLEEVRRLVGSAEGGDDADRLQEPQERRAQRARPVPLRGGEGEDRPARRPWPASSASSTAPGCRTVRQPR